MDYPRVVRRGNDTIAVKCANSLNTADNLQRTAAAMPQVNLNLFAPFCCLLVYAPIIGFGEDWPGWRGVRGDGTTIHNNVAIDWDGASGRNIAWKSPLPGEGHSSPIVCGDRVFVTTCLQDEQLRLLICLDRQTGRQVWERNVVKARLESKHTLNSYASSTPTTDGELVFVCFLEPGTDMVWAPNVGTPRKIFPGKLVVAAYDFDGNQKWLVRPGSFVSAHGFASSPVVFQDLLIVNGDHDGESYLFALDKQSGKEVWRTPRRHKTRSYATPLLREIDGKMQMALAGSKCVAGFSPRTGERIWTVEGPTEQFVASMVYADNRYFVVGGYPTHHVLAVQADGIGNVTDTHVDWHKENVRCYVPSPVVVGEYLLVADDRGTANCFSTVTGKRFWQSRMGKHFSASLIATEELVYFLADDGNMKIVRPADKPDIIATNAIGENVYSSPAVADGQLFIRGVQNLYCICAMDGE